MQSFSSDVDYFSFINESTTAPIMQMQHQSQERFESHLENLWNRDPYLNHVKQTEAEMLRSIERRNEERQPPLPLPLAMNENIKWTTIVSRCRKPSLNADENPSHRSSQFLNADDGFQEDYSDEEENNKENVANGSGGSSSQRTTESPGSSSAHRRKLVESQRSNNGNHLLDKRHIFYRIHYCTFWQAWIEGKGPKCRRGDTCFFAHGPDKLKKLDPMYYKTVLCEKFVSGDECPYGPSCNFAHGEKELRKTGFWGRQQVPNMQYHKHPNK